MHVSSSVFHSGFLGQLHAHTCPLFMYCSRLFDCLHMPMFVGSQSFISPPSFMFVSAAVSEIRELNQNKEEENNNSEIYHLSRAYNLPIF